MKLGELEYAVRKAHNFFDDWNDVTGLIEVHSSYYDEILSVIADAVKVGAKVATFGKEADLKNLDRIDK